MRGVINNRIQNLHWWMSQCPNTSKDRSPGRPLLRGFGPHAIKAISDL